MPPPGVSLFQRFRCYLKRQPAPHGPLRHPPPPGVSLFRRFRCYLNRQPAPHGPLRHPPPPGVSLFRHLCCYLNSQPAPHGPLRHLHRVTQAPDPTLWQRERGNRVTYGTPIKLSATRGYFFFTKCELRNQILSYCLSNTPENISISLPEIPNRVANLRHPFTTSITSEIIFSAVFRLSI